MRLTSKLLTVAALLATTSASAQQITLINKRNETVCGAVSYQTRNCSLTDTSGDEWGCYEWGPYYYKTDGWYCVGQGGTITAPASLRTRVTLMKNGREWVGNLAGVPNGRLIIHPTAAFSYSLTEHGGGRFTFNVSSPQPGNYNNVDATTFQQAASSRGFVVWKAWEFQNNIVPAPIELW